MTDLKAMGALAKQASYSLLGLNTQDKDLALLKVSVALEEHKEEILLANAEDVKRGVENGMHPGMIDRLKLSDERIADMAEGLRTVMGLKDPIGEVIEEFKKPFLDLSKYSAHFMSILSLTVTTTAWSVAQNAPLTK